LSIPVRERNNHKSIAYRLSISDHGRHCRVLESVTGAEFRRAARIFRERRSRLHWPVPHTQRRSSG
jgi:hypothetical protein